MNEDGLRIVILPSWIPQPIPDKELTLRVFLTRKNIHQIFSPRFARPYPLMVRIAPTGKPPKIVNVSQREELMLVPVVRTGKGA